MSLFMNKFFYLGSACLLNKLKIKAQAWLIYKQTNMNNFFIKPSSSCSLSPWFIYSLRWQQHIPPDIMVRESLVLRSIISTIFITLISSWFYYFFYFYFLLRNWFYYFSKKKNHPRKLCVVMVDFYFYNTHLI